MHDEELGSLKRRRTGAIYHFVIYIDIIQALQVQERDHKVDCTVAVRGKRRSQDHRHLGAVFQEEHQRFRFDILLFEAEPVLHRIGFDDILLRMDVRLLTIENFPGRIPCIIDIGSIQPGQGTDPFFLEIKVVLLIFIFFELVSVEFRCLRFSKEGRRKCILVFEKIDALFVRYILKLANVLAVPCALSFCIG